MIRLAEATWADIEEVEVVVRAVWDQEILPDVARDQIEDAQAGLWVARERGDVVGFVSAFLTVDATGRGRWEIDLLAVRPGYQGQGVGRMLIERAWQETESRGAALSRAAIRVDNRASQRAFEKAGFVTDGRRHRLLLWSPSCGDAGAAYAGAVHLIRVETLTYRGLWLEGLTGTLADEQRRALRAARSIVTREGRLNAGSVIAANQEHRLAPDLRSQAELRGEYQWFVRRET